MRLLLAVIALAVAAPALAQGIGDLLVDGPVEITEGWSGFADVWFLLNTLLTLLVAVGLGAVIAYHPRLVALADSREEIEAPKVFLMYSVIGALIGVLVVKYGLIIGFILFGIGGLMRFRTTLRSANLTGRLILVTLIGLTCGLNLPHIAVLGTAFAFGLIYLLESRVVYRIDAQGLPAERIVESAEVYRRILLDSGCRILLERKDPKKGRLTFLISSPELADRERIEAAIDSGVAEPLRGTVDWRTD